MLCELLSYNNRLRELIIRNCDIGDNGSAAIAHLIDNNKSIVELEIFHCSITEKGGNEIGNALKTNFCIEKLSIGDNELNPKDVDQIQQSVIFNTQYNQMKESNKKFEGFAHNLIAESLLQWAHNSHFVEAKLKQRLKFPEDELDKKIAQVINNPKSARGEDTQNDIQFTRN